MRLIGLKVHPLVRHKLAFPPLARRNVHDFDVCSSGGQEKKHPRLLVVMISEYASSAHTPRDDRLPGPGVNSLDEQAPFILTNVARYDRFELSRRGQHDGILITGKTDARRQRTQAYSYQSIRRKRAIKMRVT